MGMKLMKKPLAILLTVCMLASAFGSSLSALVVAESTVTTIVFDNVAKRTGYSTVQQVWEENGITVTNDKATSASNVGDYSNPMRVYKGSSLTIAYPGITKLVFTCDDYKDYATVLAASIGTAEVNGVEVTVTLDAAVDVYVIDAFTSQVRLDSITVYAEQAAACRHTDDDEDTICDICEQSVVIYFDFYGINDLHGKFADTKTNIGVDELSTYLKNARETDENAVFLAAGDMFQGSPESNITYGNIVTDWMSELDFAAMAVGNHDFDWGEEQLKNNAALAEFPVLAINVYEHATGARAPYCAPSTVVEADGLQIGIIGAIGDCYSSIAVDKCDEVYFKVGDELTQLVKEESDRLREEEGADLIVYVLHDGYGSSTSGSISSSELASYYDVSLSNGYVDLVFEGHTHQSYCLQDSYGVYHLQNGGDNNNGISHAEISINAVTGAVAVQTAERVNHSAYADLADDAIVQQLMDKYDELIAPTQRVLGTVDNSLNSSAVCQLVADLYRATGEAQWGDRYDIVLGGGYLNTRSPYTLSAGTVTYGDLMMLLPFDNDLVLCSIKGSDLSSRFFHTSNADYYISCGDYGTSVKDNINANATYYVVVDTYTSDYAANKLTVVEPYETGVYARDLVAAHIEAGNLGSKPDPEADTELTIAEAVTLGISKQHDTYTAGKYYVTGKVASVLNTTFGNLFIEDEKGNSLYVYTTYNEDGSVRFDGLDVQPVVGDTVKLYGIIGQYNGTAQIKNAWIAEHVPVIPVEPELPEGTLTIPEANELGLAQGTNTYTADKYYVSGKILAISSTVYGNMYIVDEQNNQFYIYGVYNDDGSVRYDGMDTQPVVGDTVTVYGIIGTYNGKEAQMKNGWVVQHTPGTGEPESTDPEANAELTIEQAIALGASKLHNIYTTNKYYVTGTVKEIYNETYGNMYITDAAGNTLTIYGSYNASGTVRFDGMETKPVVGDTVTLYGIIGQYNNTPQMKNAWIVEINPDSSNTPSEPEEPIDPDEMTTEEILNAAFALPSGASLPYEVTLTGTVISIVTAYDATYGNMTVGIRVEGRYIQCYRMKGTGLELVKAGDRITVTGTLRNYSGTVEFNYPTMVGREDGSYEPIPMEMVTDPQVGVPYKMGIVKENVSATDVYYLNGEPSGHYLATGNSILAAVDVYLAEAVGGYYLHVDYFGTKKYINLVMDDSNGYINPVYESTPTTVYTYDAERNTMQTIAPNGVLHTLGAHNYNTYTTIGAVQPVDDHYFSHFYAPVGSEEPEEPEETEEPEKPAIPGDADGDGKLTLIDVANLQRYLADWDVSVDESAADVNKDENVNNKDLVLIIRYLNGWDVELL